MLLSEDKDIRSTPHLFAPKPLKKFSMDFTQLSA